MENYLESRNVEYNKKLELVSNEAIKQSIIAGLGYSIMPIIGLKNELLNGSIEIIPIKNLPIVTTWHLVYNSGKQLTPAANRLKEMIEEEKYDVIQKYFGWEGQFVK